jgi:hypothetical protein
MTLQLSVVKQTQSFASFCEKLKPTRTASLCGVISMMVSSPSAITSAKPPALQLIRVVSARCDLPDNYVMLPNLVRHLVDEAGKGGEPLWIGRRGPKHMKGKDIWPFTMGGAGYCLDYAAAKELGHNNLADECLTAKQPDDMTIGLVMQRQKVTLHHSPQFHSQCK